MTLYVCEWCRTTIEYEGLGAIHHCPNVPAELLDGDDEQ